MLPLHHRPKLNGRCNQVTNPTACEVVIQPDPHHGVRWPSPSLETLVGVEPTVTGSGATDPSKVKLFPTALELQSPGTRLRYPIR